MKKIILVLPFLIAFSINIFPQWSTDPNNNLIVGYGLNPELCSDSAGGCYITYEVGYPSELYLHRVDKYGYQPWGDKRIIAGELDEQRNAKIIEDGEGGVILSYGDRIMFDTFRLRIQRVDSNGNFLWGTTGVRVSIVDTSQSVQRIVSDGDGGCLIVWMGTDSSGFAEYRMNRIDRNGQRVWSDSGLYIQSDYNYSPPNLVRANDGNYYLKIRENLYRLNQNGEIVDQYSTTLGQPIPDQEGGIVLSNKVWTGMIPKLVSQRKDSLGNNLWQEPYVEIADSLHINTMLSIIQHHGYYFYGWMGRKNGNNEILQIQGLRNNGTLLFNEGSISLSSNPGGTTYIPIIPSDSGSCLFISNYTNINVGTFGQKIDTLGLLKWNPNQVLLSYPELNYLNATTDCAGGAIGVGYFNSDFGIRVFKVSSKGILGEIITSVSPDEQKVIPIENFLFQNYPNPFNPTTQIRYSIIEDGLVELMVYDLLGREVASLVNEEKSAGNYEVMFDAANLSSGIYFYTITANDFYQTRKMILLK